MKVLMTARWPVGGIKTYLRYTYSCDVYKDIQLTLIAPDIELKAYLEDYLPRGRIRFIACENSGRGLFKKIREEAGKGYDLIHSHGYSAAVITALASLGKRIPHLMTAHDVFTEGQFKGAKGKVVRSLISLIFKQLDCIHTVTGSAEDNLKHYFPSVKKQNVQCIEHGINEEYFRNGQVRDLRQEFDIEAPTILIGFFGRFMAQKGFRTLADAVKIIIDRKLLDSPLLVCTFGYGGFIREDYQYVKEQGLTDYFMSLPGTDDMPGSIKGVDLVAMPSNWEAAGLLAMEVLCCGVPIVGTDCVGLKNVLEGTPAGIVKPRDSAALADAIVSLLKPSAKSRFKDYQDEACDRFSIKRPAEALAALYMNLVQP
jgi:glycosyltransferase involved in cell wall biosynthesis